LIARMIIIANLINHSELKNYARMKKSLKALVILKLSFW